MLTLINNTYWTFWQKLEKGSNSTEMEKWMKHPQHSNHQLFPQTLSIIVSLNSLIDLPSILSK